MMDKVSDFDKAHTTIRKVASKFIADQRTFDVAEIIRDPRCRKAVELLTQRAVNQIVLDVWREHFGPPRIAVVDLERARQDDAPAS
jgi:hypothetical protein